MERIVKFLVVILLSLPMLSAFADTPVQPQSALGTPQVVTLPQCIKTFNVNFEKLLFLTEAAISSSNYNIEEIQTQGGYIVFTVSGYKFLATVMDFGDSKAILKITPCNGNYTFPPVIIRNIFLYIESNQYKKF